MEDIDLQRHVNHTRHAERQQTRKVGNSLPQSTHIKSKFRDQISVQATIFNTVVTLLFDTGAQISLLGTALADKLGINTVKRRPVIVHSVHPDKSNICTSMAYAVPIAIGEQLMQLDFFVLPLKGPIIIGMDLLNKYGFAVDMRLPKRA